MLLIQAETGVGEDGRGWDIVMDRTSVSYYSSYDIFFKQSL